MADADGEGNIAVFKLGKNGEFWDENTVLTKIISKGILVV